MKKLCITENFTTKKCFMELFKKRCRLCWIYQEVHEANAEK